MSYKGSGWNSLAFLLFESGYEIFAEILFFIV